MRFAQVLLILLLLAGKASAGVVVRDDAGNFIRLDQPARHIVSLSPHNTELLFAAGAGSHIVGVVEYSNYPPQATSLPLVGSAYALDVERIASLQPDLVVAWGSGNARSQIEQIRQMKIPVFISEPKRIDDIADTLRQLGALAGTAEEAEKSASAFTTRLAALRSQYAEKVTVTVFYEVWNQPLMTVGGKHVISQIIELCGGHNIFSDRTQLAPALDTEAVLHANPEVIVASGMDVNRPDWLDNWRQWPALRASAFNNLYAIPPDLLHRQTPRILDGAQRMCEALDSARAKRHPENQPDRIRPENKDGRAASQ